MAWRQRTANRYWQGGGCSRWISRGFCRTGISRARVGDCLYVPLVDHEGGLINDPVLLILAEDRFWLSIADSDVLLYALGLALGAGLRVEIDEPDVSPLAVQGPKAEDLMARVFGDTIREIGFFKFTHVDFEGTRQIVARSGYSRQGGFEIYLEGGHLGAMLWDRVWKAGQPFDIAPGCPNLIERIEGGLFSYGNEMTRENTPLELGLGRFCALDGSVDCIGLPALRRIAARGVDREIKGLKFSGGPVPTCSIPWPVMVGDRQVGQVTSGTWSLRFRENVGLSLIERGFWDIGQPIAVHTPDGERRRGEIVALPMA